MAPQVCITGLDGKTYPRPISRDQRAQIITRVHHLAHQGLSIREILAQLAREGVRRSSGSISTDLNRWTCSGCVQVGTNGTPEQSEVFA